MKVHDYIVVGSGMTGAMAAQTLVEAGAKVTMLDVGFENKQYESLIPTKDYLSIRRTEKEQYQYFIGKKGEGVVWGKVGKGEQITPPRKHIFKSIDKFLPVKSKTFAAAESLGYGGLGIGWGLGCWEWSDKELKAAGLQVNKMREAYNIVNERVGISATADSAAEYTIGTLKNYQSSPKLDHNHQLIYKRFQKQKNRLQRRGFVMGRAPLALLTQEKKERKKYSYKDMDFYSDKELSAYRPWITINQLKKKSNFSYINDQLVLSFEEKSKYTIVRSLNTTTNMEEVFHCKKLVLAPGVLGTARIVLRSLNPGAKLPLLCNPYTYVPCLLPRSIGKDAERRKLGFAQLSLFLDEDKSNFGAAMASLYSYQSLMLFRMVRQIPLNFRDARPLLRYLSTGLIIMGIHQPDSPTKYKYVSLSKDSSSPTGDALSIQYELTQAERQKRKSREKQFFKAMRSIGVWPIKRMDPGFGSSIHYGGVLPFSKTKRELTLAPNGRLHGTKNVFVADGSGLTYLPAKGLTFSLMANAHLTAQEVLKS